MRNAVRVGLVAVALSAVVPLAACTASDRASTATSEAAATASSGPASEPQSAAPTATTPAGPACTAADIKVTGDVGKSPTVTIPDSCSPPPQLLTADLVQGSGAEVKAGANVLMNYQLTAWSTKQKVDSSFDRGQPFPVENVGQAKVIKGWNQGLIGMKQGGRRLLVIPPDLGYGPQGAGGDIKPNETLVFVVDAVQVG
jgi:peptidylprolyl isomerase